MTRKHHLCQGLLCIGLALAISSPSLAGWGSFGGSFGSGGSLGASHGSHGSLGSGGSFGSGGSAGGGLFRHHRRHHGSFGSYGSVFSGSAGSHGSSGSSVVLASHGSGGGSNGGSSGGASFGSSGGLFHGGLINKLREHHARKMAWLRGHGSSGGSSGGSHGGSSGGSNGGASHGGASHGSHGGHTLSAPVISTGSSHGSHGGSVGGYGYSSPIATSSIASTTATSSVAPIVADSATELAAVESKNEDGSLVVTLPTEAKLFVNGQETSSTGPARQFVSKGLKSGYRYPYTVKAVMDVDGREVVRTKNVELRAGDKLSLAFNFAATAATKLTVRVPEGATVELAGTTTQSEGAERQFSTTKLSEGQLWEDYQVVVTSKGVSKTQTIDLRGGESRTLTFDFDTQEVASR